MSYSTLSCLLHAIWRTCMACGKPQCTTMWIPIVFLHQCSSPQGSEILSWGREIFTEDGISGEMAWKQPIVRQWKSVSLYWCRLAWMDRSRFNKNVALWSNNKIECTMSNFAKNNLNAYCSLENNIPRSLASVAKNTANEGYTTS